MEITFIRHTSVAVENGTCYGWTDVETAVSFPEEARQVKEKLKEKSFDAVYSSPLSRCRKLAAYCGYPHPIVDDRLKELNFGRWEMKKWDKIQDTTLEAWFQDWQHLKAGGAESYSEQCARVAAFLDEIKQKDKKNVGVFAHRGVIAAALVYTGYCAAEDSFSMDIPYGECIHINL